MFFGGYKKQQHLFDIINGCILSKGGVTFLNDFFTSVKFKVLVGIAIFLIGMMAYVGANGRLTAAPQEIFALIITPFQSATARIGSAFGDISNRYTNIDAIVAENEALLKENAELKDQMVDYDKMLAENEAYKELEGLRAENPEVTYLQGFVIGRDTLDNFGGFTIDKGTTSDVEIGDSVIGTDGSLIGIVVEANLTSSRILTILHPSFSAAAMVSRTRDNGIVAGSSEYAEQGLTTLNNLSRDSLATVGDVVITTGLGEMYPPDIRLGTIVEIQPEISGKSSVGIIEPGVDILTVKQVFVITDY